MADDPKKTMVGLDQAVIEIMGHTGWGARRARKWLMRNLASGKLAATAKARVNFDTGEVEHGKFTVPPEYFKSAAGDTEH